MERKKFIKSLSLFAASGSFLLACGKDDSLTDENNGSGDDVSIDESCSVTPTETDGPYPTKTPSSYIRSDIRKGDDVGADMTANITIVNVNDNCNALEGAVVDIWHCDAIGNYSEYNSYQSAHWLRGRQITDSTGLVTFQTIFPGWYQGRATHIHIHVYNASGRSLLISQIAFQDSLVETVNTTGSSYGYTKGMSGYTYNAQDDILNDSLEKEMSTVTGSLSDGYEMGITIRVQA